MAHEAIPPPKRIWQAEVPLRSLSLSTFRNSPVHESFDSDTDEVQALYGLIGNNLEALSYLAGDPDTVFRKIPIADLGFDSEEMATLINQHPGFVGYGTDLNNVGFTSTDLLIQTLEHSPIKERDDLCLFVPSAVTARMRSSE